MRLGPSILFCERICSTEREKSTSVLSLYLYHSLCKSSFDFSYSLYGSELPLGHKPWFSLQRLVWGWINVTDLNVPEDFSPHFLYPNLLYSVQKALVQYSQQHHFGFVEQNNKYLARCFHLHTSQKTCGQERGRITVASPDPRKWQRPGMGEMVEETKVRFSTSKWKKSHQTCTSSGHKYFLLDV